MRIIQPTSDIVIYDNLYAKPPQIDTASDFSMTVLFEVDGCFYYGQYNFKSRLWHTLPSGEKQSEFSDAEVAAWMHMPYATEMLDNYRKSVEAGRCSDAVSRIFPYTSPFDRE